MDYSLINGIKCSGIAKSLPTNIKYFSDAIINSRIKIGNRKPCIDVILSIVTNNRIGYVDVIDTPVKVSREGTILSGKKIVVEVIINTQIKYKGIDSGANICLEECNIIKTVAIVIPELIDGQSVNELIRKRRYGITAYIEDILGEKISTRELGVTISLVANIDFISSNKIDSDFFID